MTHNVTTSLMCLALRERGVETSTYGHGAVPTSKHAGNDYRAEMPALRSIRMHTATIRVTYFAFYEENLFMLSKDLGYSITYFEPRLSKRQRELQAAESSN